VLPIVQRELRVGARSPALYKARLLMGFAVTLAVALMLVTAQPGSARGAPGGAFWFIAWVAGIFCLFEGVRKTADAISEERREGTLGFLFLTDLRGHDVVLGKLAAALIRSLNGLLAFVPILAVTLLLGGTTGGEFWRVVIALLAITSASLSVSLAVSSTRQDRSVGAALGILGLLSAAPPVLGEILRASGKIQDTRLFYAVSPAFFLGSAAAADYSALPRAYHLGLAVQGGLAALSLLFASLVTPRVWRDKPSRQGAAARKLSPKAERQSLAQRAAMLDRNPIMWLAYPARRRRSFTLLFMTVAAVMAGLTALVYWDNPGDLGAVMVFPSVGFVFLSIILGLQLSSQASVNLAEARRNGTLELLLSTPLRVRDIVQGQWLALRKSFTPAVLVTAAFAAVVLLGMMRNPSATGLLWTGKFAVEFVLELFVLGWVGMWSGLVSKTPNGAFVRTLLLGFALPFLLCTPTIINQVVLLAIAMDKVKFEFRRFVAERYLQDPKFVLPPPRPSAGAPPVIR
jgi:ABC-type transport system involved in multi-copper enzyme maturation permease subunit